MLHGWIILDKPVGLGSTTAVSAVKRILREAGEPKTKVGHGGTLDPLASGVLPIALGEATKLAGRMLDATKAYDFTIRFGEETDTLDAEGEVVATSDVRPTLEQVEAVLPALHRRDRAGAARLFGAEDRRQGRLRPRARRRGSRDEAAHGHDSRISFVTLAKAGIPLGRQRDSRLRGNDEVTLSRHRLQRHLHPLASPATSPMRLEPSVTFPSEAYPRRALLPRISHFAGLSGGSR